jgi:hypothetical protein
MTLGLNKHQIEFFHMVWRRAQRDRAFRARFIADYRQWGLYQQDKKEFANDDAA